MSDLIQGGEIRLFGTIIPDAYIWPEDTGLFSAQMVIDALARMQGDVTLIVNSDGGSPSEGEAIRAAIEAHPGKVTARVTGNAHSAASLMIMAADRIEMSSGSLMLVHDPSFGVHGNPAAISAAAAELDTMANAYAGVYAARAGIEPDAAREIMRAETMFTAATAVEAGFADAVVSASGADLPAMKHAEALDAARAAMHRVHEAQMKFEAQEQEPGLESGESQETGQEANETDGKVASMSKEKTPAPEAKTEIDAPPSVEVAPAPKEPVMKADPVKAERARVKAIREAAAPFMAHLGNDELNRMIDEGTSIEEANRVIMAAAAAGQPRTSRVEIIRDERDTMRAGMTAGLAAQLMGGDPADERGRDYMDKSIVEMAMEMTGETRTPRSIGARTDVLMNAAHTVSDFPIILGNAFNQVIEATYDMAEPTFAEFSREMTFNDFRAHDIIRPDNFPTLKPISETGEIKFGTFGEGKETLVVGSYATGIAISRQLMVNDNMSAIADVLLNAASVVPEFEEATFWAMVKSNPELSDETALFHADHGNVAATGAINVTNVAAGRKALRSMKQKDGRAIMANTPAVLIVGPEKETEAEQFLAPVLAAEQLNVNPLAKRLRLVVTDEITDATWYLTVDKSKKTHSFKHGYLDGYRAPRIRVEEPFGTQGMAMTIEHDFGCGAVGYQGAYRRG